MTTDPNKLLMQRFVTFINSAGESLAKELIAPEAVFYVPGQTDPLRGPGGYLAIIAMMRSSFPDIQWTLEEMVSEGTSVMSHLL